MTGAARGRRLQRRADLGADAHPLLDAPGEPEQRRQVIVRERRVAEAAPRPARSQDVREMRPGLRCENVSTGGSADDRLARLPFQRVGIFLDRERVIELTRRVFEALTPSVFRREMEERRFRRPSLPRHRRGAAAHRRSLETSTSRASTSASSRARTSSGSSPGMRVARSCGRVQAVRRARIANSRASIARLTPDRIVLRDRRPALPVDHQRRRAPDQRVRRHAPGGADSAVSGRATREQRRPRCA